MIQGLAQSVVWDWAADVEAEVGAADQVDVGVELGLERVLAEVGDYPVAVGTHFFAELGGEFSDACHEVAAIP